MLQTHLKFNFASKEMITAPTIFFAPPESTPLILGRTLPSLLDEVCDRHPNNNALNQWHQRQWKAISNTTFRTLSEEFSLGLITLGLQRGDRIAMVMQSNIAFCIADMGGLLAGLVTVPIDLTQTVENILFILHHTHAKALIISDLDLLYQILPYVSEASTVQSIIVAEVPENWKDVRQELMRRGGVDEEVREEELERCLRVPQFLGEGQGEDHEGTCALPSWMQVWSGEEVRAQGRKVWSGEWMMQLREAIAPTDLATLLYIASDTKRPRGVMLTHENISADILSAFSNFPHLGTGAEETALLFLPLTHIFARAFFYGHLYYGHSIYFSDPNHVVKHLKQVNPTILITVPRLLDKIYERILDQGQRLSKVDRAIFYWALNLAQHYPVGQPLRRLYALRLKQADRLVFGKWRAVFGDRLKALICGGAALDPEVTTVFTAAGIPVFQGYGLTETSAVLCYNRGAYNRAGTVGVPIPGVEIVIAGDREILVRAPFVMQGYYKDEAATRRVLSPDGWLHTGDLGEITVDGFLKITGVKKPLFKLSTGKYVSPLPLEEELNRSPLVDHAIAVGANQKFCGMLIFPNREVLDLEIQALGMDPLEHTGLSHPCILGLYQSLIDMANCHLPYWSTVRQFKVMAIDLAGETHLWNPDGTLDRVRLLERFASDIQSLYQTPYTHPSAQLPSPLTCSNVPPSSCPPYARSLTHY